MKQTRSQAVARISYCTASQHLWGSCDVIGHVTIRFPIDNFLLVVLWNQVSISRAVSEIFNDKRNAMVDMTMIRPLNKGHSFWYHSISHIRLPIRCQW